MRAPVNVGVVCDASGLGDTLARTFDELPQARLRWICDRAPRVASVGYGAATAWTTDFDELLADEDLDAVVFASTELAARGRALAALAADKHVLVDGPLARRSVEADELVDAAARHKRQLMAHSAALYRPGVTRLHRLIERGALGEIFYVHAHRFDLRGDDSGRSAPRAGRRDDRRRARPAPATSRSRRSQSASRTSAASGPTSSSPSSPSPPASTSICTSRTSRASGRSDIVGRGLGGDCGARRLRSRARALASSTARPGERSRSWRSSRAARSRFRLPADDCLAGGCARFLTAVRSRSEVPYGREGSAALAVVEALERSCATHGTIEAIAPRQGQEQENVIAFRARP